MKIPKGNKHIYRQVTIPPLQTLFQLRLTNSHNNSFQINKDVFTVMGEEIGGRIGRKPGLNL